MMFYLLYFPISAQTKIAFPSIAINRLLPHCTPQSHQWHKLTVHSYQSKMACTNSCVSWCNLIKWQFQWTSLSHASLKCGKYKWQWRWSFWYLLAWWGGMVCSSCLSTQVANYTAPNEMTAKTICCCLNTDSKPQYVAQYSCGTIFMWHNIHYAPKILKHNPKLQGSKLFLLQYFLF
jgi:hypothetical protein